MTGLRELAEKLLGPWSVPVLDFYSDNSLVINLIVLAYGLVLVSSWFNLKGIRRRLVGEMVAQVRDRPDVDTETKRRQALRGADIPWESAVSQARLPFVTGQLSFGVWRTSVEAVQRLLPLDELVSDALGALAAEKPLPTQEESSGE